MSTLVEKELHKVYIIAAISLFSNSFVGNFLWPVMPQITIWLGHSKSDVGYYSGLISSMYFFGSCATSLLWGMASDRLGRKPVLITTLMCSGLACLLLGFTRSTTIFLLVRFFAGATNGVLVSVKGLMCDFCDNENHARGISILSFSSSAGMIVGPMISGYLSSPNSKYPEIFQNSHFFARFPYAISCFMGTVFAVLSIFVIIYLFPGSNMKRSYSIELEGVGLRIKEYSEENDLNPRPSFGNISPISRPDHQYCHKRIKSNSQYDKENAIEQNSPLLADSRKELKANTFLTRENRNGIFKRILTFSFDSILSKLGVLKLITKDVLFLILIISSYSFANAGYKNVYILWCSMRLRGDEIGLMLSIASSIALAAPQLLPMYERRAGAIGTMVIFNMLSVICINILPTGHIISSHSLLMLHVGICTSLIKSMQAVASGALMMILNNSASARRCATVNGLYSTIASLTKSVAPLLTGLLFDRMNSMNFGPPLDSSTPLVFDGFMFWITTVLIYFLPRNLNLKN